MKRRTILKRAGAVTGMLAVAGCLSDNAGTGGENEESTTEQSGDGGDGSGEESTTEQSDGGSKALAESSLETLDASCGTESTASVSFADSDVSVEGKIKTSDPCHEAAFADVSLADNRLTVDIEAVESDVDSCQQCLGVVEYSAGFSFEDGGPDAVTVKHNSQGETTVVTEESR